MLGCWIDKERKFWTFVVYNEELDKLCICLKKAMQGKGKEKFFVEPIFFLTDFGSSEG